MTAVTAGAGPAALPARPAPHPASPHRQHVGQGPHRDLPLADVSVRRAGPQGGRRGRPAPAEGQAAPGPPPADEPGSGVAAASGLRPERGRGAAFAPRWERQGVAVAAGAALGAPRRERSRLLSPSGLRRWKSLRFVRSAPAGRVCLWPWCEAP